MLNVLVKFSDLVIVDPKFDAPSRWGRDNNVKVIAPRDNSSKSDFVSAVNSELSKCLDLINKRQQILYNNPQAELKHYTIVIDELLALSEGVTKSIKDSFFSLLIQTALLGRSTKIHLLLVSQRFDSSSIPISFLDKTYFFTKLLDSRRYGLGKITKKKTSTREDIKDNLISSDENLSNERENEGNPFENDKG